MSSPGSTSGISSDALLRLIGRCVECCPITVMITSADGAIEYVNPKFTEKTGYAPEDVLGRNPRMLKAQRTPARRYESLWQTITSGKVWQGEFHSRKKNGEEFLESAIVAPILASNGVITHFLGLHEDITLRRGSETQRRQAQKMEVIGQLTGGVAHDFNNLLGVILGNLDLLEEEIPDGDGGRELLSQAIDAARRAADLTHRLLTFARRQALSPKPTDLNKLVRGVTKLLSHTLGATVRVREHLAPGLWRTMVDPAQLENALVNLVVNARDALPRGGTISIETANVLVDSIHARLLPGLSRGEHVRFSVQDNGVGMPPEVLERIFEPFFTTKGVGKGTGLGLSTAYGFVKQSGGHIFVDSQIGRGTSIDVYLPRAASNLAASMEHPGEVAEAGECHETVLVVEDEGKLRKIAARMLRREGYTVIRAGDGHKALKRLERLQNLDLLFTDIQLPGGLKGVDLAKAVQAIRPNVKVLYTTGYAETEMLTHGPKPGEPNILLKPYRRKDLLRTVRAVLDQPAPEAVSRS